MKRLALIMLLVPACLIDSDHVRTEIIAVCSEDIPLIFAPAGDRSVALIPILNVPSRIEGQTGGHAAFDYLTVTEGAPGQLAFASELVVVARAEGFADTEVARLSPLGEAPYLAIGDPDANVADQFVTETLIVHVELIGVTEQSFMAVGDACVDVEGVAFE